MKAARDRARILLVAPTALDNEGQPIKERRLYLPALTLPYLAALVPDDLTVRLIYETVEDIPYDEHWDLVGITGMGSGIVRGWQIADQFRRRGTPVVFGGIAASLGEPEWTLAHADALVAGEAEIVWPQVINDFLAGSMKSFYRAASDGAQMPVPRYDLMSSSRLGRWRPVQATRGCPHTCSFCSVTSFHQGRYFRRPVDEVIRDIRAARRYGSRYIAFVDDNIAADHDYAGALWEALIPEKIIWMSQCTVELAESEKLLGLARRSGCRLVSIGIESTNPESLATIEKGWNRPNRYTEAFDAFRRNGIEVSTEMIVGFDTDDDGVFERTLDFILTNRIAVPRVHILTPVPGTALYQELERDGRITSRDFAGYTGSQAVFRPKQIDPGLMQAEYWRLYERLFSWRGMAHRLFPGHTWLGPYMRAVIWASNLRYRGHIKARISPGIL